MANKSPSHSFPKGNTIAADSGNIKRKRIRKSPLRKTEAQLKAIEPQAIKNIEDSVNGEEVDKDKVASSKWVVNTLITLRKAVTADETEITNLREALNQAEKEEQEEEEEAIAPTSRFSLTVLPTKKDV